MQETIFTCPKCGNTMRESSDERYPGTQKYYCTGPKCGWVKHISNENYRFVPITEIGKKSKKRPQVTDEN